MGQNQGVMWKPVCCCCYFFLNREEVFFNSVVLSVLMSSRATASDLFLSVASVAFLVFSVRECGESFLALCTFARLRQ